MESRSGTVDKDQAPMNDATQPENQTEPAATEEQQAPVGDVRYQALYDQYVRLAADFEKVK